MITLRDILKVIKRYWFYFAATVVIVVAGFALYAEFALPVYYESSTRIYCFAVNDEPVGKEQAGNGYTDKFAANHAIAMLSSGGFYYELYDMFGDKDKARIGVSELKSSISYSLYSSELNIVDIACVNADNELAQRILVNVDALIESKLKKLPFENTTFNVLVDESPSLNGIPITAPKDKYYIYGLLAAALLCGAELLVLSCYAFKKGLIETSKSGVTGENGEGKLAIKN